MTNPMIERLAKGTNPMIDRIAKAIEDALVDQAQSRGGYLGERDGDDIMVDGTVDLAVLAKAVSEVTSESTKTVVSQTPPKDMPEIIAAAIREWSVIGGYDLDDLLSEVAEHLAKIDDGDLREGFLATLKDWQ